MRTVGTSTNGSTVRLTSASFQSLCSTTNSRPSTTKVWRSRSARMCEVATWIFSISFMIDDIRRPVECASKNCATLPQHLVEDGVAQVGDRREADVVDQVVGEVIAEALDREHDQDGEAPPWSRRCGCRRARTGSDRRGGRRSGTVNSSTGVSGEAGFSTRSKMGPISSAMEAWAAPTQRHQENRTGQDETSTGGRRRAGAAGPSCAHPQALQRLDHLRAR